MKKTSKKTITSIKRYFNSQRDIVEEFVKKQGFADVEYGHGVWWFNESELFFNIDDIIYDMYNNVKPGTIITWYNNQVEAFMREESYPNYSNYVRYFNGFKNDTVDLNKIVNDIINKEDE